MSDIDSIIRKHVLKNAFDYGKPNAGSVVGKVIGEVPDAKNDMKSTMKKINEEVARVSKLDKNSIEKEMSDYEYTEKKEEKKSIELPNAVNGKVVTRFPPEPSGYPHIGHAKAGWLDFEAANNYEGKMILRFDDTNPEKESYQYVEAIKAGLEWLGISWASETYTSDNMPKIYDAAEKLINSGFAYICTCSQDEISKGRTDGTACACRSSAPEDSLDKWRRMIEGDFNQGEIILRFKGDLKAENTVMRDPTLARILETKHFKQLEKYRVWPSYDLAVCVMDHIEGVTHSMRSKEYELRDELYLSICKSLDWSPPELIAFSRLAIKGAPISKRLLLPLVQEKKVLGWDDPRLPTLAGLKRRGISPLAIKDFVLSFGLSKVESEPDWEVLLSLNRKLLDPKSNHYFFVPDPVLLEVEGLSVDSVSLKLHPKNDGGQRELKVSSKVYIPSTDANNFKDGEIFRLKDLCNVQLLKKGKILHCKVVPDGVVEKKVQWVSDGKLECEVLMPKDLLNEKDEYDPSSLQHIKGFVEAGVANLKLDQVVQFERFGFCRLDRKEPLMFIFSC